MVKLIELNKDSGIPLIGLIYAGIVDRGTNLLQVRPSTACNMNCIYCSTNSNNKKVHPYEFIVDKDYLIDYVKKAVEFKGPGIEANIDSVGEPLMYPKIIELIKGINKIDGVNMISMQTNGVMLTKKIIDDLEKAGLKRINLSVNTFDNDLGKKLSGSNFYDVDKIKKNIKYVKDSKIQLLLAPVWIPGINDEDIVSLIEFSKNNKIKIGVQKYEVYKFSRKIKGVKPITFWKFFEKLKVLEKEHDIDLIISAKDFNIEKRESFPLKFKKGEKIKAKVLAPGWWSGQSICVSRNRAISVVNSKTPVGKTALLKIIDVKNNLYLAEEI